MNRREFLHGLGWTSAGITVLFTTGCSLIPPIPSRPAVKADDAVNWIQLGADGRVRVTCPRQEIGQNILTACRQVAAEELGLDLELVEVAPHGTDRIAGVRATVGSESVKDYALPLAGAAARLRDAIIDRAAARTGTERQAVVMHPDGVILAGSHRTSIADIAAGEPLVLAGAPRGEVALRTTASAGRRLVGQPVTLAQGRAIVTGEPLYASDVRLPGMLYGAMLRAPVHASLQSRLQSVDEAAAGKVAGFVRLVRARGLNGDIAGVVADRPWALPPIMEALKPRWSPTDGFAQEAIDAAVDVDRALARGGLRHRPAGDRVDTDRPWTVDLRIDIPLAAHAPMEPRAAVAWYRPEGGPSIELWVGHQDVFYVRDVVARVLGLSGDRVTVHGQRVGGAFGGKTICTVELEAALLSQAVGRPVKLQWSREEEFRQSFYRPPSAHRVRLRVGPDGRIADWHHAFLSSHILFTNAVLPEWLQSLTDFVGDDGVARGALPPYRAGRTRIEFDAIRLPVYTGPWRGLGAGPNGFAIECAIDECARRTGADPLEFRLRNLKPEHHRLRACLERVARRADWSARVPGRTPDADSGPAIRRGRGIAGGIYKAMSYVAVVADVTVDRATGAVRVDRLVCAHDCGLVINPDQVRAQVEGNLVWGIGMILSERLTVRDAIAAETSYADYVIPGMADVPPLEIDLIETPGDPPAGAGETAIVAAGAAIANAIRDAVGVRLTRLPVDAAVLKRAGSAG